MRKIGLAFLALAVSGLFLPMVLCLDACPEDDGAEQCPPVCSLCVGCPRVPGAVVTSAPRFAPAPCEQACEDRYAHGLADAPPRDILHVPLAA